MIQADSVSKNIGKYEAGDYCVTAASWTSISGWGPSYEIGIRDKNTGKFYLLQNRDFNSQSVQDVANAIAHLLFIKTESYTPEWCIDWFGREKT